MNRKQIMEKFLVIMLFCSIASDGIATILHTNMLDYEIKKKNFPPIIQNDLSIDAPTSSLELDTINKTFESTVANDNSEPFIRYEHRQYHPVQKKKFLQGGLHKETTFAPDVPTVAVLDDQTNTERASHHLNYLIQFLDEVTSDLKTLNQIASLCKGNDQGDTSNNVKMYDKYENSLKYRFKRYAADMDSKNASEVIPLTKANVTHKEMDEPTTAASAAANTSAADAATSGRRSMSAYPLNQSSIKTKLLVYVEEGLEEVTAKVNSLQPIKEVFSNNILYKIGYIVSSVDTLAVNVGNLRGDIERYRNVWNERDILNVYDQLKVSNSIVTYLLDVLRLYAEKSNYGG